MTAADVAQIIESFSVTFGVMVAIYGLSAWRGEHIGKRLIELAEDVLALFYQASDAIDEMRNPVAFDGEGGSRKPAPNERPEHTRSLDAAYVLIERYRRHSELFAKLYATRYRFMAQVGVEKAAPFDKLNKIVNELIISAHQMARMTTAQNDQNRTIEANNEYQSTYIKIHNIYYSTGGKEDLIAQRVKSIIAEIESTCRSIIEGK